MENFKEKLGAIVLLILALAIFSLNYPYYKRIPFNYEISDLETYQAVCMNFQEKKKFYILTFHSKNETFETEIYKKWLPNKPYVLEKLFKENEDVFIGIKNKALYYLHAPSLESQYDPSSYKTWLNPEVLNPKKIVTHFQLNDQWSVYASIANFSAGSLFALFNAILLWRHRGISTKLRKKLDEMITNYEDKKIDINIEFRKNQIYANFICLMCVIWILMLLSLHFPGTKGVEIVSLLLFSWFTVPASVSLLWFIRKTRETRNNIIRLSKNGLVIEDKTHNGFHWTQIESAFVGKGRFEYIVIKLIDGEKIHIHSSFYENTAKDIVYTIKEVLKIYK